MLPSIATYDSAWRTPSMHLLHCVKIHWHVYYNALLYLHYTAESLRWGKTYWQATSEQAERPVVDLEVDAYIEGSLAAESSLIVLDTMELLMHTIASRENLHSTLGRVSYEYNYNTYVFTTIIWGTFINSLSSYH